MGDRTHVSLTVHHCPPEQAQAVLNTIEQYGLHPEYDDEVNPDKNVLALGLSYMDPEVYCGSAEEISRMLRETAPDAAWTVFEDPKYEWLGAVCRFTPELGHWQADCATGGDPVFGVEQVQRILTSDTAETLLGITHDVALASLLNESLELLITPPPSQRDWQRAVAAGETTRSFEDWLTTLTARTDNREDDQ